MGQHSSSVLQAEVRVSPSLVSGVLLAAGLSLYLASEEVANAASRSRAYSLILAFVALAGLTSLATMYGQRLARWVAMAALLAGIAGASTSLGLQRLQGLYATVIVLAAGLLGLRGATLTTLAASALVLATSQADLRNQPHVVGVDMVVLWSTLGAVLAIYRPVHQVLGWLWEYQERAHALLQDSRQRKGELEEALHNLAQANRQLALAGERTGILRLAAEKERQAKAAFVARVSHEFRAPLNMIIGLVSLMVEAPELYAHKLPPDYRRDLEVVHRNCQHLAGLVDDVLDLSRAEAGQVTLRREPTDLGAVIREVITAVRPLVEKKRLALDLSLPPNLPEVHCDRTRIYEVLLNLVTNAARVTGEGAIRVTAEVHQSSLLLCVADTGPGISPQAAQRIFEPFYQVTGTARRGGSGLGLAISKQYVELHGGRIWLESKSGAGTAFFVELPLSLPTPPVEKASRWIQEDWLWREDGFRGAQAAATSALTLPRVLACDPTGALVAELQHSACEVEIAQVRDLDEASRALEQCPAHALLVNTTSYADPWDILDAARQRCAGTLVVGCSVSSPVDEARSAGAFAQLVKPIALADLRQALQAVPCALQRVLAVDDDPDFLQLLRAMLRKCDSSLRVRAARNGTEALRVMRRERPDLVLLDIVLPGMDGWQVLQAMKDDERLRAIPVLLVSAQDPGQRRATCPSLLATVSGGLSAGDLLRCSLGMSKLLSR